MKQVPILILTCTILTAPGICQAEKIFFMQGTANIEFDDGLVEFMESIGHDVTRYDASTQDGFEQLVQAAEHDLIYVTESVSSAWMHDTVNTHIKELPLPQIWAEAYAWDEAAMVADIQFEDFGNTQREDGNEPPGFEDGEGQDSIFIQNPDHPLAGGYPIGPVKVYVDPYSVNWGLTTTMGRGVEVIATLDEGGQFATLFTYDEGAIMEDGSEAPGKRIGIWLAQPGDGNIVYDNIEANGLGLLANAINYGLGLTIEPASGDFNGDGVWNETDIDLLSQEIVAGADNSAFDLNGDSIVNTSDLSQWLSDAATENGFTAPFLDGDANLDGTVNAQDLNRLALRWQQPIDQWSQGDFNSDGLANAADLNVMALNWQRSIIAAASPTAVPEPRSQVFLLLGLAGFAYRRCGALRLVPKTD